MTTKVIIEYLYKNKFVITLCLLIVVFLWGTDQCTQNNKATSSIRTLVTGNKIALELDKKSFIGLYSDKIELYRKLGIATKNIKTVIEIPYAVHDSVIKIVKVVDTIKGKKDFSFEVWGSCVKFEGNVIDTDIYFSDILWQDNLTSLVYVEKPQWIKIKGLINWKKFWKPYNFNSKVASECKGDTVDSETKIIY